MLDAGSPLSTPSISATFELASGQPLRVIATHPLPPMNEAYWRSRNLWFEQVAALVRSSGAERTIIAGDLNCTPWSPWFERLCRQSGLRNSSLGHGLGISWMPIPISVCGLPIDHVLVGESIRVHDRQIGPDVGSDHRPVIVDFQ